MKRTLVFAAAIGLLYDRQRRVERRLQEQRAYALALDAAVTDGFERINSWQASLVKQIERAFKEGAR